MRPKGSRDWRTDHALVGLRKADDLYDQVLDATLSDSPRSVGERCSSWTRRRLAARLGSKLGVSVSESTVGRHLRRLGWSLVRPALTVRSPDPKYALKAAELETLKARAKRGEVRVLFEDEVDLNLLPGVTRCWTRVGEQRKVPTPGVNQKRYGFGAVDYVDGTLVSHFAAHKDSAGFSALIEAVVERYCPAGLDEKPKVVLVVDNYGPHSSKLSQSTLDKYADRLEVFHLPTYSPNLNLIEFVWKHLRATVTHNHFFESIDALLEAVRQFFTDLANDPHRTLSLIGNLPAPPTTSSPNHLCATT